MDELTDQQRAVEVLQQLGLKEYEAQSFVALSRLPHASAKEVSEISEVPRTRVYDAVRVLESMGLVEIQHSNPRVFRAVSIEEAAETLRSEFESRTDVLRNSLEHIDPAVVDDESSVTHEVWSLSGDAAITNRTQQLIDEVDEELVFVIGHEAVVTEELLSHLRAAQDRGVEVVIATVVAELRDRVQDALPEAEVYVSGLDWLSGSALTGDDTEISRLLLIDRSTILVSSYHEDRTGSRSHEQAVFGRGFDNGFVAIVRRLMATGLMPTNDPARA